MDLRQTRCPLLLVADYRFFSEMGGGSSKTTVNYLISLIDRVHKIYEETVWRDTPGGQGFSGMGFIIKKIVVHRKPTTVRDGKFPQPDQSGTVGVEGKNMIVLSYKAHFHFILLHNIYFR